MISEGQNLKPTLEWLRAQIALMDGCCLDNPEDVERVAQHLYGNWVMVERSVTQEMAGALSLVSDYFSDRQAKGYFDWPFAVVDKALDQYLAYNPEEVKP